MSGLISIDFSTQNLSNSYFSQNDTSEYLNSVNAEVNKTLNPINILKIGGEYRFKDISFRAGYHYQTKNQETSLNEDQAITLGIGFDFGGSNLSLSLIKFEKNQDFVLFPKGLSSPYQIKENLTQLTLSYNFKL